MVRLCPTRHSSKRSSRDRSPPGSPTMMKRATANQFAVARFNIVERGDRELVGGMFLIAKRLMNELGHTDYRTVVNCGPGAQQSIFHIHLHVLAGRKFEWPPG